MNREKHSRRDKKSAIASSYDGGMESAMFGFQPDGRGMQPLEYMERLNSEATMIQEQLQNKVAARVGHAKTHEARVDELSLQLQAKEQENSILQGQIVLLQSEKQGLLQKQASLEAEVQEKEAKLQGKEAKLQEKEAKLQEQNEKERQLMKETTKIVKEMGTLYARLKGSNDYISQL